MTIAVGVACPEGVVIAADTRSSIQQLPAGHRVASDYAHKVFEIGGSLVGAAFGWATLENKTISGHVHDFATQTNLASDVKQASVQLSGFFGQRIQAHIAAGLDSAPQAGEEPLGFILGGYDSKNVGHIVHAFPYGGSVQDVCQTSHPGGIWAGQPDAMSRLFMATTLPA
jgi:20S proteasome alpha/beta subunit